MTFESHILEKYFPEELKIFKKRFTIPTMKNAAEVALAIAVADLEYEVRISTACSGTIMLNHLAGIVVYATERAKSVEEGRAKWKKCTIKDFYVQNSYPDLKDILLNNHNYASHLPHAEFFTSQFVCSLIGECLLKYATQFVQSMGEKQELDDALDYWIKKPGYVLKPFFSLGEII